MQGESKIKILNTNIKTTKRYEPNLTIDSEASIFKNYSSILGVAKFSEKVTTVLNACVWVVISPCNDLGWIQMIHGIFPKTPPLSPGLQIS